MIAYSIDLSIDIFMKTLYYKNIKLDNYYGKVNRIAHTRRTKKI